MSRLHRDGASDGSAGMAPRRRFAGALRLAGLLAAAATIAGAVGCNQTHYTSADRYDRGLVLCLSGAGGMMGECDRIRDGLASGGVDQAIEIYDWSRGEVLSDQTDVTDNRRKAADLARHIEAYLAEHPGKPVHLIGISAGTGLIIWALEDLTPPHQIEGAVIMASSLDTKYNLGPALAKVRDHIYSFGSPVDPVLSLGVTWAGTVDRGGGLAGGLVGFSPPDSASEADKELYKQKLILITWWPGDWILGNSGTHLGSTSPTFVRVKIAPLILGKELPPTDAPRGPAAPASTAPVSRFDNLGGRKASGSATAVKAASSKVGGGRFFGWNLRPSASLAPAASTVDERDFFKDTEHLP